MLVPPGTGNSPRLSQNLLTRLGRSSSQRMPESMTAITVSGRPVVTSHARLVLEPLTPNSSWGLLVTVGS